MSGSRWCRIQEDRQFEARSSSQQDSAADPAHVGADLIEVDLGAFVRSARARLVEDEPDAVFDGLEGHVQAPDSGTA